MQLQFYKWYLYKNITNLQSEIMKYAMCLAVEHQFLNKQNSIRDMDKYLWFKHFINVRLGMQAWCCS
jgi:hypothetical protein